MTITGKSFYNGTGRIGNKLLVELMTGQNSIKDFLDEIKNNTEKILDLNKNILNNIKSNNQLKEELEEKEDDKKFKNKKENNDIHKHINFIPIFLNGVYFFFFYSESQF